MIKQFGHWPFDENDMLLNDLVTNLYPYSLTFPTHLHWIFGVSPNGGIQQKIRLYVLRSKVQEK